MLDAGDLFFPAGRPGMRSNSTQDEATISKAELLADAFKVIGCHGFTPGEQDFRFGLEVFNRLAERAGLPVVSANVQDVESGNRLFPDHLIVESGGVKIGIIGVTGTLEEDAGMAGDPSPPRQVPAAFAVTLPTDSGVKLGSVQPSVEQAIQSARGSGAQLIVLLAHMPLDHARTLLQRLEGIHLTIAAHDRRSLSSAEHIGGSILVTGGYRGMQIGQLVLHLQKGDLKFVDAGAQANLRTQLDATRGRLAFYDVAIQRAKEQPQEETPPTPGSAHPGRRRPTPRSAEHYQQAADQLRKQMADLEKQLEMTQGVSHENSDHFVFSLVPMDGRIPANEEVRAITSKGAHAH